ncbi:MAG: hypothetical protein R6W75_13095 [Smithellaceae bacterium]
MQQMGAALDGRRKACKATCPLASGSCQRFIGFQFPDEGNNGAEGRIELPADEHVVSFAGPLHDAHTLEPGVFIVMAQLQ